MIISEVTLSYPCVHYKAEVSHFTARKSTAIEWVILESTNRCDALMQYEDIPIALFFEQIFAISDANQLIRPCLLGLHDMGAINISGIDDEAELATIPMGNLKLTKIGKEMQSQGLLPGTTAEDTFEIYYDVVSHTLRDDINIYKENATGIKVIDIDEPGDAEFPMSMVRAQLASLQGDKKKNRMNWLSPTTKIQDITPLESAVLWKNTAKKIDLTHGMQWKLIGVEDESLSEKSLMETELSLPDEFKKFPEIRFDNPDEEIESIIPVSEINALISTHIQKDDLFCIDERYYTESRAQQANKKKKLRIGFVFGTESFDVVCKGKQIIIYIPESNMGMNALYRNSEVIIQAGIITVFAGSAAKDMAIAYIPKSGQSSLSEELLPLIDRYCEQDSTILFALVEMGLKDLFFEYVECIVRKEDSISKKAELVDSINAKSIGYYNQKMISATDKERLVVCINNITERCKTVDDALVILNEFASVNSLRQDETIIQRVIRILIDTIGEQKRIEDIWDIWKVISNIKKSHINWVANSGLYRTFYSIECLENFFDRFGNEDFFEIEEYTTVERIALNLKRIYARIQEMLPDFDMFSLASDEKYRETITHHMDVMSDLYDQIRQWKDEEERFSNRIVDIENILVAGTVFANVKTNIDGLRTALARFYDDSFMKYNKIYIVDTCALMNEPDLISWFDGENALLVVPMVVLNELDRKKSSDDKDKASRAQDAARIIKNYEAYEWLKTGVQSCPEILSDDLDRNKNDNKILSVALMYRAKEPTILTDDINFGNIADAHKIKNMTSSSYRAMMEHKKLSKDSKKNKKKGKKK